MMQEMTLIPHAASLSQSMRDLGYSLETAIADLIDNCITAQAHDIRILFSAEDLSSACVAIVDDGTGMSEDVLFEAMRPGSRNPRDHRTNDDLGRFGLGLKTGSFSQCKCLTVISRKDNCLVAAQWDLDFIAYRNEWIVRVLSPAEIEALPFISELGAHGTCILWQKLDRLIEGENDDQRKRNADDKFDVVEAHLALVFHRFLAGEYQRQKIGISINGHPVKPFDPFCTSNKATQMLQEETVRVDGEQVVIQPYILPHHSKLSRQEYDFYRTRSEFISNQGAYVYRNGRLIAWGDWFRIIPKTEATKLARVRIDFSSNLDEYWTIDIRKSRANPPYQVRTRIRTIIGRITDHSKRIHIGRGSRLFDRQHYPLWSRYSSRTGISYRISREHPLVQGLQTQMESDTLKSFESVLSVIESSLPLEAIYSDYASSPQSFEEHEEIAYGELRNQIVTLYRLLRTDQLGNDDFARMLLSLRPFSENKRATEQIIEELL